MSSIKEFVKRTIKDVIEKEYPQAKTPACLLAVIKSRKTHAMYYEYMVRVLDTNGEASKDYPEMPVRSDVIHAVGETVVLATVDALAKPYIIGRWYG